MNVLEVRGLSKNFGDLTALNGISFNIRKAGVYLFIGPNGSGKSTLLKIIAGVLAPDVGSVSSRVANDGFIGYMPQDEAVYPDLTVMQNLRFFEMLNPNNEGWAPPKEMLVGLKLQKKRDVLASELSRGMRRALSLACTLVAGPDIIVLDEPTTGFDYTLDRYFWLLMHYARESGKLVLMSSHSPSVLHYADRIFVLKEGELMGEIPGSEADSIRGIEEALDRLLEKEAGR